ncbi:MAG: rhodanese-like domain-containing protein [Chlorobi bacterium]|nr:rhodanese-like domain-containing protein [Chlorobiota bacterium]
MKNAVEVCPTTALGMIEKGALLVDVREADEVAEASFDVPEVMLIPYSEFEERFGDIPVDREVVVACNVGERSLMATYFLMNHGYEKVANMQYGIVRWAEKGFPMRGELKRKTGGCCCGDRGSAGGGSCC